jgi:DNA-binding transcriptional ArsR family regulator
VSARRQIIAALSEDSHGGIATLHDVERAEQLVDAYRAEVLAEASTAGPADTNRRARLLHEIAFDGGRWKSGDVVRWYQTRGLTGLGVRTARHDLAILRDSGAITQHDEKGVRFYTRNIQKGSRS